MIYGKDADEYEYIGTFIKFLKEIIDIIINLFNSLSGGTPAPAEDEDKTEE